MYMRRSHMRFSRDKTTFSLTQGKITAEPTIINSVGQSRRNVCPNKMTEDKHWPLLPWQFASQTEHKCDTRVNTSACNRAKVVGQTNNWTFNLSVYS